MNRVIEHGSPCQVMVGLGDDESMAKSLASMTDRLITPFIGEQAENDVVASLPGNGDRLPLQTLFGEAQARRYSPTAFVVAVDA